MSKLHQKFMQKSSHYKKWHEYQYHEHHYWLVAVCAALIAVSAIVGAWQVNVDEQNRLIINFEQPWAQAQLTCTYYVATDGNDNGAGIDINSPWGTIQHAADVAQAGQIVCIRGGVYVPDEGLSNLNRPSGRIIFRNSGQSGRPITFMAYDGESVVLDGQGRRIEPVGDGSGGVEFAADYIMLDGLEIRNFTWSNGVLIGIKGLGKLANHITLKNCDIHENGTDGPATNISGVGRTANGILIGEDTLPIQDVLISRCKIHHNGFGGYDHGIYAIIDGLTIERSEFYENKGNGLKNADFEILVNGTKQHYGDHWLVKHSVFYRNGALSGRGIYNVNFPGHGEYYNNLFMENDNKGVEAYGSFTIENNLFFNNCTSGGCTSGNGSPDLYGGNSALNFFSEDPRFVSASNYDFHLTGSSVAAIDKGKDLGETYSGAGPDIGADEYGGSATCDCTAWQNQSCGSESCSTNQMYQTRSCTPSNCSSQSHCINDTQCTPSPPVCNDNGICDSGEDTQHCPDDCPAPAPPADGRLTADFNCDNYVNIYDFGNLMSCWGSAYDPNHPHNCAGGALSALCGSPDLTGDGQVGVNDLGVLLSYWGTNPGKECLVATQE